MKSIRSGAGNGLRLGLATLALCALALVPAVRADDDAGVGPPASGAARLSSVEGQVRISSGGQVIADPAPVNSPLFAGTRIETGDDGKAEIQFDDGTIARVSPDSAVTVTAISGQGGPAASQIVLEGGLAYFELQGGINGPTRVIFGDSAVTATGFTVLRIRLDNPPGELAVFSGNAHLDRGNALAVDIHGGESIALNGTDPGRYNLSETIEPDSWDSWNSDRDQALNAETADQTGAADNFVNNQNPSPAWNDLDANGNWYNVPGQGYIWSPYDASDPGWDPYGNGNWMNTPGYGYIFISAYPWGYMPYQCGSWNFYGGFGWGWAPGIGGCNPWWRTGRYHGPNIGYGPGGYRPIPIPRNRGPIGRTPPKVISVHRGPFNGGTGGLPPRTRNTPVQIGGATVTPLRPRPGNQRYEPSQSGFTYHPTRGGDNGSRDGSGFGSRNGDRGDYRNGDNRNGDARNNNPGSYVHTSPGTRQIYVPPTTPRETQLPAPRQPVDNGALPGGNPNPGGNPGNRGGQDRDNKPGNNNGFRAQPGTIAPRSYNGGFQGTGQMNVPPTNNGGNNGGNNNGNDQRYRPTPPPSNPGGNNGGNPGGNNPRPTGNGGNPNGGGSFQRPSNPGGNQGGGNSGGAPRGGGTFSPQPTGGGGAPRGGSFTPPPPPPPPSNNGGGGGGSRGGGGFTPAPSGGGGGGAPHGGGGGGGGGNNSPRGPR